MAYRAVPKSELEYLEDVARALSDVVAEPEWMAAPSRGQEASILRAIGGLRRAGFPEVRAAAFVRSLRAIGIQKPSRFVLGLRSDYAKASYRKAGTGPGTYLAADDYEAVALLLQTVLYLRADMRRRELPAAAIVLANRWLEAAGYDLPNEAPPILHIEAFHAGVTVSECADALRELVAWGRTHPDASGDAPARSTEYGPREGDATPGLPSGLSRDEERRLRRLEGVDPSSGQPPAGAV